MQQIRAKHRAETGSPSEVGERLTAWLNTSTSSTGDNFERVAAAEAEGFTDADARRAGWMDLFHACMSVPSDHQQEVDGELLAAKRRSVAIHSFGRGLIAVTPIAPITVLLSGQGIGLTLLWVSVIVGWGLGLAFAFSARRLHESSPGSEYPMVRRFLGAAVVGSMAVGALLVWQSVATPQVITIAAIQVVYVLAANALVVMEATYLLAGAILPGAVTAAVFWTVLEGQTTPWTTLAAGASLLAPVGIAMWRARPGQQPAQARPLPPARGTAIRFGLYGTCLAVFVLWLPMQLPGEASLLFSFALVACVPLNEIVVAAVRSLTGDALRYGRNAASVLRSATTAALGFVTVYCLVLAGVLAGIAAHLAAQGYENEVLMPMAIGVWLVGSVQVAASLGVAYHGLEPVSVILGTAVVGLIGGSLAAALTSETVLVPGAAEGLALLMVVALPTAAALFVVLIRHLRVLVHHA